MRNSKLQKCLQKTELEEAVLQIDFAVMTWNPSVKQSTGLEEISFIHRFAVPELGAIDDFMSRTVLCLRHMIILIMIIAMITIPSLIEVKS